MITLSENVSLGAVASVADKVVITLFGMELTGTTEVYRVLGKYVIDSVVDVFYAPSPGNTAFIKSMTVVNSDAVARTFQLFIDTLDDTGAITPRFSIPAGGMAIYEDSNGWQVLNSDGQVLQAGAGIRPGGFDSWCITGALYETMDRNTCPEVNTSALTSGRLTLQAIWIPAGNTISSISFWSATTAGGTLTNQLFGLYDNNLNLLRATASDGATAWGANAQKKLNLTSAFVTTYTGLYYLGIMVAGTTVPTLKGGTARTDGSLAYQTPSMGGTSNTGLSTTLPSTATAPAKVTTSIWGCVNS